MRKPTSKMRTQQPLSPDSGAVHPRLLGDAITSNCKTGDKRDGKYWFCQSLFCIYTGDIIDIKDFTLWIQKPKY